MKLKNILKSTGIINETHLNLEQKYIKHNCCYLFRELPKSQIDKVNKHIYYPTNAQYIICRPN